MEIIIHCSTDHQIKPRTKYISSSSLMSVIYAALIVINMILVTPPLIWKVDAVVLDAPSLKEASSFDNGSAEADASLYDEEYIISSSRGVDIIEMVTSISRKLMSTGIKSNLVNHEDISNINPEDSSYGGVKSSSKEDDRVVDMPGQPQSNLGFAHYAGYVTVNESHGRALFYWFFEATSDPSSKPLLLWLNGGPGCSSVGYGQSEEIGPLRVNSDGASVTINEYAWNKEVNLLFLESPAGVGFSYSNTSFDYQQFGDALTAEDAYNFLVGWFARFPEYKSRDFYIAGESYAGHYIPQLAKLITEMNNPEISLKGVLMGNALIDDGLDTKGIVDYAWSHAILSDTFYQNITKFCNDYSQEDRASNDCNELVDDVFKQYSVINIYGIYADECLNDTLSSSKPQLKKRSMSSSLLSRKIPSTIGATGYDPCIDYYVDAYLNREDVQHALHTKKTSWSACSDVITKWNDSPDSMLPTLKELMNLGLRIWMFSGDWDGRIPVLSTRYSIESMNLPTKIDWYPWYYEQQVAGWSQVYEGITYATVRAAGHMVPSFEPGRALALLKQFLIGTPLPSS